MTKDLFNDDSTLKHIESIEIPQGKMANKSKLPPNAPSPIVFSDDELSPKSAKKSPTSSKQGMTKNNS